MLPGYAAKYGAIPNGSDRQDRHAEWLGRLHRHPLGQDGVRSQGQVRVLFGRAGGQDDPVVPVR